MDSPGVAKMALFLDVENMGNEMAKKAVDFVVESYSPQIKEMAIAEETPVPHRFRNLPDWKVRQCKQGRDAADRLLQSRMRACLRDDTIDGFILVTSDHGFADVCKEILAAGKKLVLIVNRAKRLLSKMWHSRGDNLRIISTDGSVSECVRPNSTVFVQNRAGELCEVPFYHGMKLSDFVAILRNAGLYHRHITAWLSKWMLEVREISRVLRVYVKPEEVLWES